jgi:UDP-N-acetylglucosamine 2-epimerase (non-hydrolysing)
MGTNVLVGQDRAKLRSELNKVLTGEQKQGTVPPLWDGQAGKRIAEIVSGI